MMSGDKQAESQGDEKAGGAARSNSCAPRTLPRIGYRQC